MELPHVPQDDLMDVLEMTSKLESHISNVLKDNERNLALSALMSATINSMIAQCDTLDEVVFFRNLFMQILDGSIRIIRIQGPDQPSS